MFWCYMSRVTWARGLQKGQPPVLPTSHTKGVNPLELVSRISILHLRLKYCSRKMCTRTSCTGITLSVGVVCSGGAGTFANREVG